MMFQRTFRMSPFSTLGKAVKINEDKKKLINFDLDFTLFGGDRVKRFLYKKILSENLISNFVS